MLMKIIIILIGGKKSQINSQCIMFKLHKEKEIRVM